MSHPIHAPGPSPAQRQHPPRVTTTAGTKPKAPSTSTKPYDGPSFREMLGRTAKQMASGERLIDRALHAPRGREVSYEQLLSLQAGVYRYTREVELAGKLVERSTSALKQTLQSQQ